MISFRFNKKVGANFTPSEKIIEYAKKSGLELIFTLSKTLLLYNNQTYEYNHYTIYDFPDNPEGIETVEIFLSLCN